MAKFNYDDFVANLPDAYRKDNESNNYKLLSVDRYIYEGIYSMIVSVYNALDVDKATGKALDMLGRKQGVKRGTSTDEQYRIRIKGKIAQSLCDGSRDSVAAAIAYILSADTSQVKLKTGEETGKVDLLGIPLKLLYAAKFSPEEINNLLDELLPEGVHLNDVQYVGTFTYGSIETQGEYTPDTGYGNIEQTIGGYYGLIGGYN